VVSHLGYKLDIRLAREKAECFQLVEENLFFHQLDYFHNIQGLATSAEKLDQE
jgi:hypothetical protein